MKKRLSLLFVLAIMLSSIVFSLTAEAAAPTKVTLNRSEEIILRVGETFKLSATVEPSDASQDIKWISSNNAYASVSTDGLITAKAVTPTFISIVAKALETVNAASPASEVKTSVRVTVVENSDSRPSTTDTSTTTSSDTTTVTPNTTSSNTTASTSTSGTTSSSGTTTAPQTNDRVIAIYIPSLLILLSSTVILRLRKLRGR